MLVKELIAKLQTFDPELKVSISDGYDCRVYEGKFQVELYQDDTVDIWVGGCLIEED